MLETIIKSIFRKLFSLLVQFHQYRILNKIYSNAIVEINVNGKRVPYIPNDDGRLILLFISPAEFRSDQEALASRSDVCALELPDVWLTRLLYQFYPKDFPQKCEFKRYVDPDISDPAYLAKKRYQSFLLRFLPTFYHSIKVDCVVGHHVLHSPDIDWGTVSNELGVPYLVIHREGVIGDDTGYGYKTMLGELKAIGGRKFTGTQMLVQNDTVKQLFTEGGFLNEDQVTCIGTLRMDNFIHRIAEEAKTRKQYGRLVFFTFIAGASQFGQDTIDVFNSVHAVLLQIAKENPDIEVVIKPKGPDRWFDAWKSRADVAFAISGIDPNELPNLTIDWKLDPHDLILTSDVVTAFSSTTIMEAGIAGRHVVVPYFGGFRKEKYDNRIYLREHLGVFDIPESEEEYKTMLLERMNNYLVQEEDLRSRCELFGKLVSSLDGNATEKSYNLMRAYSTDNQSIKPASHPNI
jgi:hypothetical protein